MTSSKVIEANLYRKAITTMDTTWCVSVLVLSKTGKVEKTLISNALKKIGSKNTWEDFLEELLDDVEVTDDENDALDKTNVNVTISIVYIFFHQINLIDKLYHIVLYRVHFSRADRQFKSIV